MYELGSLPPWAIRPVEEPKPLDGCKACPDVYVQHSIHGHCDVVWQKRLRNGKTEAVQCPCTEFVPER